MRREEEEMAEFQRHELRQTKHRMSRKKKRSSRQHKEDHGSGSDEGEQVYQAQPAQAVSPLPGKTKDDHAEDEDYL